MGLQARGLQVCFPGPVRVLGFSGSTFLSKLTREESSKTLWMAVTVAVDYARHLLSTTALAAKYFYFCHLILTESLDICSMCPMKSGHCDLPP